MTAGKGRHISHKLLGPSPFLEKFLEILEWSTLGRSINDVPPPYLETSEFT